MKNLRADWKPLIEMPKNIPSVSFVTDEAALQEYNGRVKKDFKDNSVLKVYSFSDGVMRGSNSYANTLFNSIIAQLGYRVSNQADLEKAISLNALPLRGQYEDTALVLRNTENPNTYLAQNLAEQVKKRGHNLKQPLVIPLSGLELVNDENSPSRLAFKLTDESEIIQAPILAKESGLYINPLQIDKKTGLPTKIFSKTQEGNRQLWTRNSGLSGLYLGGDLSVGSDNGDLAFSDDVGRVVLVSGEATANDVLAIYQKKLEADFEAQKSELSERFKRANAVLRG